MKYRIYEVQDRDELYYFVKKWKLFFWGLPKTTRLSERGWSEGGGTYWWRKHFKTLKEASDAVQQEIEYNDRPTWKKVMREVDADIDYPNI